MAYVYEKRTESYQIVGRKMYSNRFNWLIISSSKGEKFGSLGVVKNIKFQIVSYLPRFFMLIFVKFYVFIYRILLYFVI